MMLMRVWVWIAFLLPMIGNTQNKGGLKKADYPYYFILDKTIRDVRSFKIVSDQIVRHTDDQFTLSEDGNSFSLANHTLRRYALYHINGTLTQSFQLTGREVMDWNGTHKLFVKDQDIWAADVDWKTGKYRNERQLTQLGTFNARNGIPFTHWYEDWMILFLSPKCYLLNTKTGELRAMIDGARCYNDLRGMTSPDGRYLPLGDQILDMQTLAIKPLSHYGGIASWRYWKNNHELLFLGHLNKAFMLDMKTGVRRDIFEAKEIGEQRQNFKQQPKISHRFSPLGTYFVFIEKEQARPLPHYFIIIGDTKTGIRIEPEIQIYTSTGNILFNMVWTTDGSFIYSTEGDALTQGTWFYDMHRKTHKRITPYIANQIIFLKEAKKVVLTANNHVFTCNEDGANLVQLSKQPLGRWQQELKRFLK